MKKAEWLLSHYRPGTHGTDHQPDGRAEGINKELKASDQLGWIGRMNSIRVCAEETVLAELVYE